MKAIRLDIYLEDSTTEEEYRELQQQLCISAGPVLEGRHFVLAGTASILAGIEGARLASKYLAIKRALED